MRALIVLLIVARAATATADPGAPLRVNVQCEGDARTKACPAFLLGFVAASKLFLDSPRSSAEVVVYASTTQVASIDHVHLHATGTVAGAPPLVETDVEVDTRADDDTQRGQLEPGFQRVLALFVAARHPKSVTVAFTEPDGAAVAKPETSPYGIKLDVGAFGSYTEQFQAYNASAALVGSRIDPELRLQAQVFANGGLNRQPPIFADDGTEISLDTSQWSVGAAVDGASLLSDRWSLGGGARVWKDDPFGQFRYGWNAKAGIEWDRYKADDPRGNRLAVLYALGYQGEAYNIPNILGESAAHYPIHVLVASGAVRKDKLGFGLSLAINAELLHPDRRSSISASPFVELQLGAHVDIGLSFSVTRRELPGPNVDLIDPSDVQRRSRLSFAEPLSMNGSLSFSIHFDRTNGARNDRFTDI